MGWRVMWFAPPPPLSFRVTLRVRRRTRLGSSDGRQRVSFGGVERRNSSDPGVPDVPLIDQSAQGDKGAEKLPIISC